MTGKIRFLTRNPGKFRELEQLLDPAEYSLIQDSTEIHELQTEDMDTLVRDKVLKAFKLIRHPLIVDHTGLEFDLLKGFPAGLTSVFYDKLGDDGIASLIGKSANRNVTAITLIGYCDGRRMSRFAARHGGPWPIVPAAMTASSGTESLSRRASTEHTQSLDSRRRTKSQCAGAPSTNSRRS